MWGQTHTKRDRETVRQIQTHTLITSQRKTDTQKDTGRNKHKERNMHILDVKSKKLTWLDHICSNIGVWSCDCLNRPEGLICFNFSFSLLLKFDEKKNLFVGVKALCYSLKGWMKYLKLKKCFLQCRKR